jgi:pyruvate formate lyase activating enzyme
MNQTGTIFDIQRASLHDGPGIRTTVFLKGCPLRCQWCHNPESQRPEVQTGKSGKIYGHESTVDEIMEFVEQDRHFFESSGGGLTLSGGEPTHQFAFCKALLSEARLRGIHTALETSGQVGQERLAALIPLIDVFLYDYKATGEGEHLRLTRSHGDRIRDNLEFLLSVGATVILRCPMIPETNDSEAHLKAIRAFAKDPRIHSIEMLPYHDIGRSKANDLGVDMPCFRAPNEKELERWEAITGQPVS